VVAKIESVPGNLSGESLLKIPANLFCLTSCQYWVSKPPFQTGNFTLARKLLRQTRDYCTLLDITAVWNILVDALSLSMADNALSEILQSTDTLPEVGACVTSGDRNDLCYLWRVNIR
jgi:hypothetical protein